MVKKATASAAASAAASTKGGTKRKAEHEDDETDDDGASKMVPSAKRSRLEEKIDEVLVLVRRIAGEAAAAAATTVPAAPAASAGAAKKRIARAKKCLDQPETHERYLQRLKLLSDYEFESLDGAYVSAFRLDQDTVAAGYHHAAVLIEEAERRGVKIAGVTSETKKNGAYVHVLPEGVGARESEGGKVRVVYIGDDYALTGHKACVFSLAKADLVFLPEAGSAAPTQDKDEVDADAGAEAEVGAEADAGAEADVGAEAE
jgi:hypothetical protein